MVATHDAAVVDGLWRLMQADRIGLTDIDVSSLGERRRFTIGDNLAEGAKLPAAKGSGE